MFVLWLFCGLVGTYIGIRKGLNPIFALLGGLILGVFSPLMIFVTPLKKKCPVCAELVQRDAIVCRYCNVEF